MTPEWWLMRVVVERKRPAPGWAPRWLDVSGDEVSDERVVAIRRLIKDETYVLVPHESGQAICEPLECFQHEDLARVRLVDVQESTPVERFLLVMTVAL